MVNLEYFKFVETNQLRLDKSVKSLEANEQEHVFIKPW